MNVKRLFARLARRAMTVGGAGGAVSGAIGGDELQTWAGIAIVLLEFVGREVWEAYKDRPLEQSGGQGG